jgi:hypothetical protein
MANQITALVQNIDDADGAAEPAASANGRRPSRRRKASVPIVNGAAASDEGTSE